MNVYCGTLWTVWFFFFKLLRWLWWTFWLDHGALRNSSTDSNYGLPSSIIDLTVLSEFFFSLSWRALQLISMKHSIMTMNHMVYHRNPSRMFHRNELCMDHSFSPSQDSGPHENNLKLSMSKTRAPHYHPNSPIKSFCLRISILEKCLIIKTYMCLQPPYNHLYINLVVVNVTHILVKTANFPDSLT